MSGAIEIKDRNSNVRLTMNAQGAMFVDTITPIGVNVSNTPLASYAVGNPSTTGAYIFSAAEQSGVVAANNFLTLFNPIGSGKTLTFSGASISSFIVGDTATSILSMRGYRITTATGGTLQAASATAKFSTTMADPAAEVRIGNPSVTLGACVFNSPPFVGAAKGSVPTVHQVTVPAIDGPFNLVPGEGIVLRTEAGDVDTRWNLSVAWGER